jgi:phosphoribosylamine---glycine ligase
MNSQDRPLNIMALGVGAFVQGVLHLLKAQGANVSTYLTRNYAHYSPSLVGETYTKKQYPNPCVLFKEKKIDFVIPMSIDWILQDWAEEFYSLNIPIFSPTHEGMQIERDRDFGYQLCQRYSIPFPPSFVARNRIEALNIVKQNPRPYVIKNPLCSPTSPVHTIICETVEDTLSWLEKVDYAEGVFLQEYLGRREVGHIAFISGGEIYSLVTNQEYKRAFNDNLGVVAGAPMGGLVEQDPNDKYGLAKNLIHPLLPWFRKVNFHGPIQVTAVLKDDVWQVIEYNVRIGVTSGSLILEMLENSLGVIWDMARNQKLNIKFKKNANYGALLTLVGYGYPYTQVSGPPLPVQVLEDFDCQVWWNEVDVDSQGQLYMTGHRIADVISVGTNLSEAFDILYRNVKKIRCVGSYYRTDIGKSLWPPGNE